MSLVIDGPGLDELQLEKSWGSVEQNAQERIGSEGVQNHLFWEMVKTIVLGHATLFYKKTGGLFVYLLSPPPPPHLKKMVSC